MRMRMRVRVRVKIRVRVKMKVLQVGQRHGGGDSHGMLVAVKQRRGKHSLAGSQAVWLAVKQSGWQSSSLAGSW